MAKIEIILFKEFQIILIFLTIGTFIVNQEMPNKKTNIKNLEKWKVL